MPQSVSETSLVTNACPIQLGNSNVLYQDEFGNSDVLDVEEYSCTNRELVNLENAAVNIDNSDDVIIGPVTQFNVSGNVTIYQNGQGHHQTIKGTTISEGLHSNFKSVDDAKTEVVSLDHCATILYRNKVYIRNLGIILLIILACLFITLIFIHKIKKQEEEPFNYDYKENYYGNHLGEHKIYYRTDWGGKPPKNNTVSLKHPISLIIISHSATQPCASFEKCSALVKRIQDEHISKPNKYTDIGYNFLIGGDGNIYVGRSWDIENFHRKNSIGISLIGDFNFDEFTAHMIDAVNSLMTQGLKLRKLDPDYNLVGENQTNSKMHLSPGSKVYETIKNWPHFYNGTMF